MAAPGANLLLNLITLPQLPRDPRRQEKIVLRLEMAVVAIDRKDGGGKSFDR